ncbi:MAG: DedA family protein [Sutterellaceae bacterium]|nr:DedA family protein [Sutterellaceae bacterium]MDD7442268.1 DedA family protein [Sutterellaceae bacterium]MDY2867740.1 DedA family protein [Mesosutterella sp.]
MIESLLANLSYGSVFLLMFLESTALPIPGELVVTPAAYLAASGARNLWLVLLAATAGGTAGALTNYALGRILGRPVLNRFSESRAGKLLHFTPETLARGDEIFRRYGVFATAGCRFVAGIRHLVPLAAGASRMNPLAFTISTAAGAAGSNAVLAALGAWSYRFLPPCDLNSLLHRFSGTTHAWGFAALMLVLLAAVITVALKRKRK